MTLSSVSLLFRLTGDFSSALSSRLDSQWVRAALVSVFEATPRPSPPSTHPASRYPHIKHCYGATVALMCWPTLTLWFNTSLADLAHTSTNTSLHPCTHNRPNASRIHTYRKPHTTTHTHEKRHTSTLQSELSSTDLTLNSFKGGEDDVLHETNF